MKKYRDASNLKIHCLRTHTANRGRPYVIVYALAEWPTRTKINRGWRRASTVYVRAATEAEKREWETATRYRCYRYETWEELVADEAEYNVDANHLREQFAGNKSQPPSSSAGC